MEGAVFYRVVRMDNQPDNKVKIQVIQGGLNADEHVLMLPAIKHETTDQTGILHKDGVISMARVEPGTATSEAAQIKALEREVRELKRANEILLAASSFFARELDPRLPW